MAESRVPVVDDDLRRIAELASDLQFYRSVEDDGGLGAAAYFELRLAVDALPESRERVRGHRVS